MVTMRSASRRFWPVVRLGLAWLVRGLRVRQVQVVPVWARVGRWARKRLRLRLRLVVLVLELAARWARKQSRLRLRKVLRRVALVEARLQALVRRPSRMPHWPAHRQPRQNWERDMQLSAVVV